MSHTVRWTLLALASGLGAGAAEGPEVVQHVVVYQEPGRFGGWPANHGMWSWGQEIVVGFSSAYFKLNDFDGHPYDRARPEEPRLARSLDGGRSWTVEAPRSLLPPAQGGQPAVPLKEPMDFTAPGFAMTLRFTSAQKGPALLYYSTDRGKTWKGAFQFPLFGFPGVPARTDYLVNGRRDAMVFLTASKPNGREGRVFCARTTDGGLTWRFVSWIGPDPGEGFSIMPSTVRLSRSELLTAFRHQESPQKGPNWIEAYRSRDNGQTWEYAGRPVPDTGAKSGNPPSMIRLSNGVLAMTYGYRSVPFSIRTRLSRDRGRTWGGEIMLRDGGGAWDVGYCRSVERPDGKIVTVYYWAPERDRERIIAATIWDPGRAPGGASNR